MAWVFAYGSLMGDNALRAYPAHSALIRGYHRAFNHFSRGRWGTKERACPILGLSPGGECWGLAFDVPRQEEKEVLRQLNRREASDERMRIEASVELAAGAVSAWVWVSREAHRAPTSASHSDLARALEQCRGAVGTGVEYVRTMVHAMELHGIKDPVVESLWAELRP